MRSALFVRVTRLVPGNFVEMNPLAVEQDSGFFGAGQVEGVCVGDMKILL